MRSVADGLVDWHSPDVEAAGSWLRRAAVRCIRFLLLVVSLYRDGRVITDEFHMCRRRLRCPVPRRRCGQVLELPLFLATAEWTASRRRHITLPHGPSLGAGVAATVVFPSSTPAFARRQVGGGPDHVSGADWGAMKTVADRRRLAGSAQPTRPTKRRG